MSHRYFLVTWIRLLVVGVACLVLQACSMARVAYDQLPVLAQWRIGSYLELSGAQSSRVLSELDDLQRWHQQSLLPRQIDLARDVQRQLVEDISAPQACAAYEAARAQLKSLLDKAEPAVVWLAMSLTDRQIDHLEKQLAKGNGAWREQWMDSAPREQMDSRYQQWLSRSEMIYGRLDDRQKGVVRQAVVLSPADVQRTWEQRLFRQQDFLKTLRRIQREPMSVDQATVLMRDTLARTLLPTDPGQRRHALRLRAQGCETFIQIHNATSSSQRDHAARTLGRYIADFESLARTERQGS